MSSRRQRSIPLGGRYSRFHCMTSEQWKHIESNKCPTKFCTSQPTDGLALIGASTSACSESQVLVPTVPYMYKNGPWLYHDKFNTLRPRQNGCHFPDICKWFFLNENVWISIKITLKFVPGGPINNIPALVQIMAWRRPDTKPFSETMMVSLPHWVNSLRPSDAYMCQ